MTFVDVDTTLPRRHVLAGSLILENILRCKGFPFTNTTPHEKFKYIRTPFYEACNDYIIELEIEFIQISAGFGTEFYQSMCSD